MRILHSFDDLSSLNQPIHLALGVFDGIHKGHREVIQNAVTEAKKEGCLSGVFTFEKHPMHLVCPEKAPLRLLADTSQKARLISSLGVDVLISLPFDKELSNLTAPEFLDALASHLKLRSISVGHDWKFGKNRQGDTAYLRQEGIKRGFNVYCIPPVLNSRGERISSTLIREAVARGELSSAKDMLGRDYTVIGTVVHGRKLATELGYPTANIDVQNEQLPPSGIYLVKARLNSEEEIYGVANLGIKPTVEKKDPVLVLEVHLLAWSGDLYGQELEIAFLSFIREEKTFSDLEALKKQITRDEQQARKLIRDFSSSEIALM